MDQPQYFADGGSIFHSGVTYFHLVADPVDRLGVCCLSGCTCTGAGLTYSACDDLAIVDRLSDFFLGLNFNRLLRPARAPRPQLPEENVELQKRVNSLLDKWAVQHAERPKAAKRHVLRRFANKEREVSPFAQFRALIARKYYG